MSAGFADAPTQEENTLLNSRDIAALNRAREVLKRVEDAAWRRSLDHHNPYAPVTAWELGRLSDAATVADGAIFHVLSTARNDCRIHVTDAQLHGADGARRQAEPALEAPPPGEVPAEATARRLPETDHRATTRLRVAPPERRNAGPV
jgi:hypothetical protein